MKPKDIQLLGKEVKILQMLKHPNINQLIETFDTKNHLYIVLELLEGENLFENIVKRRVYSENVTKTACGTPAFVAPEVLRQELYGTQVDMWSLGTILYIMLCGYPPFVEKNLPKLYRAIKKGNVVFNKPYWDKVSREAKNCVQQLLELDIKKRLTPADLLKHPWITHSAKSSNNLFDAKGYDKRFK